MGGEASVVVGLVTDAGVPARAGERAARELPPASTPIWR